MTDSTTRRREAQPAYKGERVQRTVRLDPLTLDHIKTAAKLTGQSISDYAQHTLEAASVRIIDAAKPRARERAAQTDIVEAISRKRNKRS